MTALRALKTEEEINSIPLDQPILVELPSGVIEDGVDPGVIEPKGESDPAKLLQEQLEAAQAAQKLADERAIKAEREREEARRLAADREREAREARERTAALEGDVINGGLSAAQGERDAAKQAFKAAFEAGDAEAMANAQSRIGRAEARILSFEAGAAEIAERKETTKVEPQRETQQQIDPMQAIEANPQLLPAEKAWLKEHADAVIDLKRNNELGVAYDRAIKKGLVRGTPAYFSFLNEFMGYETPDAIDNDGSNNVQAPVTRGEKGSDGKSRNQITLSAEERETARNMGISEIEYAKNKIRMQAEMKADPERFGIR